MNKLELINLLEEYPDDAEILIFPEFEGVAEDGEEITTGVGIGVAHKNELFFLGEVQEVAQVNIDIDDEDLDEYDDDEYDLFDDFDDVDDDA